MVGDARATILATSVRDLVAAGVSAKAVAGRGGSRNRRFARGESDAGGAVGTVDAGMGAARFAAGFAAGGSAIAAQAVAAAFWRAAALGDGSLGDGGDRSVRNVGGADFQRGQRGGIAGPGMTCAVKTMAIANDRLLAERIGLSVEEVRGLRERK